MEKMTDYNVRKDDQVSINNRRIILLIYVVE